MKTLKESLFDNDLVKKETGFEQLYGFVTRAFVWGGSNVDYFNEWKIKQEFNKITKKFPLKYWSSGSLSTTAHMQRKEITELLRKLLYIITANISYNVLLEPKKEIIKRVIDILKSYVRSDMISSIRVDISNVAETTIMFLTVPAGKNNMWVDPQDAAGVVNITYQLSV